MSNDFFIAFNYLSLKEGVVLHLKKNPNPSPKDALRKIWLKIGSFWGFFPYGYIFHVRVVQINII